MNTARNLYEYALKTFPDDPDMMHNYGEHLDFDLNNPEKAFHYYKMSLSAHNNLRFKADMILFLDQVIGHQNDGVEVIKLAYEFLSVIRRGGYFPYDDADHACKTAATVMQRVNNSRGLRMDEIVSLRNLSRELWDFSLNKNRYAGCVKDAWKLFEHSERTNLFILLEFLYYAP
eukprot:GHVR01023566.1.p1 GENE.GHVR01023566.1~~GHVR01023566.1.p1  ORF type:complete len:174 (-),score=18.49 GHVR01023566.1:108-629(-)